MRGLKWIRMFTDSTGSDAASRPTNRNRLLHDLQPGVRIWAFKESVGTVAMWRLPDDPAVQTCWHAIHGPWKHSITVQDALGNHQACSLIMRKRQFLRPLRGHVLANAEICKDELRDYRWTRRMIPYMYLQGSITAGAFHCSVPRYTSRVNRGCFTDSRDVLSASEFQKPFISIEGTTSRNGLPYQDHTKRETTR